MSELALSASVLPTSPNATVLVTMPENPAVCSALMRWQGEQFYQLSLQDVLSQAATPSACYDSKEALVAEMMLALSQESLHHAQGLTPSNIAQRFLALTQLKLEQLSLYRPAIAALFAASAQPHSQLHPINQVQGTDDPMYKAYLQVVTRATDMPTKPEEAEQLAVLLYGLYHFVLFFWLFDRSPHLKATHLLVDFLHDVIRMARPMLMMPMFGKALNKVAQLMHTFFHSDKAELKQPS